MNQKLSPETAKLLVKAILLFNDKTRFTLRRGGLDSYIVAHELVRHLSDNGFNWMDPALQPPPASNLKR